MFIFIYYREEDGDGNDEGGDDDNKNICFCRCFHKCPFYFNHNGHNIVMKMVVSCELAESKSYESP